MSNQIQYYYRCEVKGIQNYIMRGNTLRELAGASTLIDAMMTPSDWGLLGMALKQILGASWKTQVHIYYYAAGGATLGFYDEKDLLSWINQWPIYVSQNLPGIHLIQAWVKNHGDDQNVITELAQKLSVIRNIPPLELPHVGPIVERTNEGNPAIGFNQKGRVIDSVSKAQQEALLSHQMQNRLRQRFYPNIGLFDAGSKKQQEHLGITEKVYELLKKVYDQHAQLITQYASASDIAILNPIAKLSLFKGMSKSLKVPVDDLDIEELESKSVQFAYENEDIAGVNGSFLGVFHIDGNSIGRLLPEYKTPSLMTEFSNKMSAVAFFAVWTACENTFAHRINKGEFNVAQKIILPIRPVVVGGDDVTAIIRADLALNFIKYYCLSFEFASKILLGQTLTASAGLAFVRTNHPFSNAEELAERLCKKSKKAWKSTSHLTSPSLISFQKVTQSLAIEDKVNEFAKNRMAPFYIRYAYEANEAKKSGFIDLSLIRNLVHILKSNRISKGNIRGLIDVLDIEQNLIKPLSKDPLISLESTSVFRRIIQVHQKRHGSHDMTWQHFWHILEKINESWSFKPANSQALNDQSIDQQFAWASFKDEIQKTSFYASPWLEALELLSINDDFDEI
jgi:hypothetical protein